MRFRAIGWMLLAASISSTESSGTQVGYSGIPGGRVILDAKVPMRDGIKLSADIYFPEGNGPFPVDPRPHPVRQFATRGEGANVREARVCVRGSGLQRSI